MKAVAIALVIDADVACACPSRVCATSEPRSVSAKRTIDAIRSQARLHAAFSQELFEEWSRHRSGYARKWMKEMYGRKRIRRITVRPWQQLRDAISRLARENDQAVGNKDRHLVELAHATDRRIISFDKAARIVFCQLATALDELRSVLWVSPMDEGCTEWLEAAAPGEQSFALSREVGGNQ